MKAEINPLHHQGQENQEVDFKLIVFGVSMKLYHRRDGCHLLNLVSILLVLARKTQGVESPWN
jgi:hypothetical protein